MRHDDTTLTYAELDDASARFAAVLQGRGVRPGDRVAMTMPKRAAVPRRLLRGPVGRGRGRADEPAAQGPGGGVRPA
ncbi:AMP-binding protein [Streptomyces sp. NPDC051364]|uniref:AMP-binding protein n=1 Tax=Streptomyces sp. NPDC051364 TaxID=3155799 RepID=UPI003422D9BA